MTKLSIVTVSYNSRETIGDTLRSINIQSYRDIEHIIIDGGSTDDTMAIVGRLGERVAKSVSEPDDGIYDAFNKGISLATGEIIGILNSDDTYASPLAVEKAMSAFEDPSIEACYSDLVYVRRDNPTKIHRHWKSVQLTSELLDIGLVPAHPTLFLRQSVYERAGGFDQRYGIAADYEFMLRIFRDLKLRSVYLPEILVKMRTEGASGRSLRSILGQNRDVRAAQLAHGVRVSSAGFAIRKLASRTAQRLRALFVKLPLEIK